ncbi:MAG TPA: carboxypeptidase-like regulatory domain-containing protein [Vicinamibacteria bacterium]|nr:carboxypeptidase-like regulatory domain-containing protein [Vicinamibacteria bacterium]
MNPTVAVRLEGTVVNGDSDLPLEGATVSVEFVSTAGSGTVRVPGSVQSDGRGAFAFDADLPSNWQSLSLEAEAPGFEPWLGYVERKTPGPVVLKPQPTLVLHPGQTLHTRVVLGGESCFDEGWSCRRVLVETTDSPFEVEVVPADGGATVGLQAGPRATHPYRPALERRVTVSGSEVWIYGTTHGAPFMAVTLFATRGRR